MSRLAQRFFEIITQYFDHFNRIQLDRLSVKAISHLLVKFLCNILDELVGSLIVSFDMAERIVVFVEGITHTIIEFPHSDHGLGQLPTTIKLRWLLHINFTNNFLERSVNKKRCGPSVPRLSSHYCYISVVCRDGVLA